MKKALVSICLFALCIVSFAAEKGTKAEAVAMVAKAVKLYKTSGKEAAMSEFNNPKGQFIDRDLYIFALDKTGVTVANGANQKLVGKNVMEMKDANDVYFIKNFFAVANSKGKGWVDYRWPNRVENTIESKSSYVEKVDDMVIGCGVYNK